MRRALACAAITIGAALPLSCDGAEWQGAERAPQPSRVRRAQPAGNGGHSTHACAAGAAGDCRDASGVGGAGRGEGGAGSGGEKNAHAAGGEAGSGEKSGLESGGAGGGGAGGGGAAGTSDGGAGGVVFHCPGCLVFEVCYAEGDRNPDNSCEVCRPLENANDFSGSDGRSCDDGLACNGNDRCQGRVCAHSGNPCDDHLPCNGVESCSEPNGECSRGAAICEDAERCDLDSGRCEPRCVVHVDAHRGDDANNGEFWATPVASIERGLQLATQKLNAELHFCDVWVTAGEYRPAGCRPDAALLLAPSVRLFGGFNGTEPSRDDRDFNARRTLLSGDCLGDDNAANASSYSDNTDHVVLGAEAALIDGFVITAGGRPKGLQNGGGMLIDHVSTSVRNCRFEGNRSAASGGAIEISFGRLELRDSVFIDNQARSGGAIAVEYGGLAAADVTFESNLADQGGAVYFAASEGSLDHCTFSGNSAETEGGGVFAVNSDTTIRGSRFSSNSATRGGAIHGESNAGPRVSLSRFDHNSAILGGAIHSQDSIANLIGCSFLENSAEFGGAAYLAGWLSSQVTQTTPSILSSTFFGNRALTGTSGAVDYGFVGRTLNLTSSVFYGDSPSEFGSAQLSKVAATYTLIENPEAGGELSGSGNRQGDPRFVDAAAGKLQLASDSPCIDRGSSASAQLPVDLDGNPRPLDGDADGQARYDIGAYEFVP